MIIDACATPVGSCNRSDLQSPAMQSWLRLQLLNAALAAAGGATLTLNQLKAASQSYVCQGSPAKLRLLQAQLIVSDLAEVNTAQPVCWTPLELEGAITYVVCALLAKV